MPEYSQIHPITSDSLDNSDIENHPEIIHIDDNTKHKKKRDNVRCKIEIIIYYILCLMYIFMAILVFTDWFIDYNRESGKEHLLNENYNTTSYRRQLKIYRHHHYKHVDPCPKYKFGCCQIITGLTHIHNQTIFHYETFDGYYNHIIKDDKFGSNCPSLNDIINGHNQHYTNKESCLKYTNKDKCCKINIAYDMNYRLQHYTKNKNTTVLTKYKYLINNIYYCPSIHELMYEYRNKYPCKSMYTWCWENEGIIIIMLSIIVIALLCCIVNNK